ncbi:MAG: helix-turn-helix transcriptional regulator [Candidatus Paracaedibacteraceae bacterium]|nr:helix-turn-helix transcriptional regulator [Candidatus Paracaedibacteraceae bacterium]
MIRISSSTDLAKHITDLRKRSKLSQSDLAIRCGLSRTAIQTLEKGKETVKLETLLKVLSFLNIGLYINHHLLVHPDEETSH